MFKNLKVDIIYHQTASDFEMEFNLCGCCRMRLLTDKSTDKKSFVGLLARGVSRSRIIITCGPLFGENGTISTVASAIGKELSIADSSAYGIKSSDKINIISGSTPLVTPDGLFGGCIIESGPQTIILLSESKTIRKTVMKNLIHPYIEQISMLSDDDGFFSPAPAAPEAAPIPAPVVPVPAPVAPIPAPVVPDAEAAPAATEAEETAELAEEITEPEIAEASAEEAPAEPEAEIEENTQEAQVTDEAEAPETDAEPEVKEDAAIEAAEEPVEVETAEPEPEEPTEPEAKVELPPLVAPDSPDLFLEPEKVKFSEKSSYALDYTPSDSDKLFLSDPVNAKPYHNPLNISIIIIAVLLLLCIIAVAVLLVFIPLSRGISVSEYIKSLFDVASASPSSLSIL